MKTLQNNFTTTEQSKRLLELGVPADSADMYIECYWCYGGNARWRHKVGSHEMFGDRKQIGEGVGAIIPCWSVGRLIEILTICNNFGTLTIDWFSFCKEQSPLQLVYDEICAGVTQSVLDFSKLEE